MAPVMAAAAGSPAASDDSAARASSTVSATNAARCSKLDRLVASDSATSGSAAPSSVDATRAANARSAPGERADTSSGTGPASGTGAGALEASGACSMMACAFVPLMPNDDTAARRGSPVSGHGTFSVTSSTAPEVQSTWDDGASTCSVFGTIPCRIACTILMTPATPAAAWVWLMFDLTEPSSSGRSRLRPYVASSACASTGSPSVVPVPCASTASIWLAESRAFTSACSMTDCWEGPFGAVSPFEAPSWLTAEPRTTARISRPLRCASERRSRTSTPTPSAQPVPFAESAKERQKPSPASPPCLPISANVVGLDMMVTPPTTASPHSPARSERVARWSATSDEEQAVSMVTAGPTTPNT
ncbi:hypothetical protein GCM10022251_20970 [Phytohabitans flavus]